MLRKCIGKLNIPNFIHDFGEFKKNLGFPMLVSPVWIY